MGAARTCTVLGVEYFVGDVPAATTTVLRRVESGQGTMADLETIDQIGGYMEGQTICALSDAAAWAATGFLRRFRPEFEAHVHGGRCPLPESFET